jgi:lipopolysaccharide export system permease protein
MRFMLSGLGKYLTWRTFMGVLIALGGVLVSILLIDLVEQMRSIGSRVELSLPAAVYLTLLKTPMLIEQTLPFVVLAGSMMAAIGLNRSSELVAIRAAGVSAWRFLTPAAFVGFTLGVLVITALNPLGAWCYRIFEGEKDKALAEFAETGSSNGIWIRQGDVGGQVVIHADSVDSSGAALENATFMFFETRENALRFTRRIRAARAVLRPGFWQLSDLVDPRRSRSGVCRASSPKRAPRGSRRRVTNSNGRTCSPTPCCSRRWRRSARRSRCACSDWAIWPAGRRSA